MIIFVPFCKMLTFLDFEKAANEKTVILLKRHQFIKRLCRKIHDERIWWEERKKKQVILLEELILNR